MQVFRRSTTSKAASAIRARVAPRAHRRPKQRFRCSELGDRRLWPCIGRRISYGRGHDRAWTTGFHLARAFIASPRPPPAVRTLCSRRGEQASPSTHVVGEWAPEGLLTSTGTAQTSANASNMSSSTTRSLYHPGRAACPSAGAPRRPGSNEQTAATDLRAKPARGRSRAAGRSLARSPRAGRCRRRRDRFRPSTPRTRSAARSTASDACGSVRGAVELWSLTLRRNQPRARHRQATERAVWRR